jgi:hypothetical protein
MRKGQKTAAISHGLLVVSLALLFLSGCNGKTKAFDYGRVENGKYINAFFNFELTLPQGWVVQTKEQMDNISKVGKDMIAGDDQGMKAMLDAAEINSANLLALFKYEVGAAVAFNPSFMMVAENLKNAPGVKNGGDYLYHTREILKQARIQYQFTEDEFETKKIDGQEFYVMNTSFNYMNRTVQQSYYSTIRSGFCISAVISYLDDEQKNELEAVAGSIMFD